MPTTDKKIKKPVVKKTAVKAKKPLSPKVVKVAKKIVAAEEKAEKIMEDTLEVVYEVREKVKSAKKTLAYLYAVGKRKTATARVRLHDDERNGIEVNGVDYTKYFPYFEWQDAVIKPLEKLNLLGKYFFSVKVLGGGKHAQAEAVRHGISRTLLKLNEEYKKTLRGEGFLTRDARKKERKKPGLKRARRAPQWAKR